QRKSQEPSWRFPSCVTQVACRNPAWSCFTASQKHEAYWLSQIFRPRFSRSPSEGSYSRELARLAMGAGPLRRRRKSSSFSPPRISSSCARGKEKTHVVFALCSRRLHSRQ